MMHLIQRLARVCWAAMLVLHAGVEAQAQSYPASSIRFVVGYPQGGSGDIVVKAISDKLGAALGQAVVVDNRPGESGAVGARIVAHSAPDGYTLLGGQTTEIVINRVLARELGYNPDNDLVPVAFLAAMPLALIVRADSPYVSVRQLIEAAQASPRGLLFASPGPGTPGHLAGELLREKARGRMAHVPFEGGRAALDAVIQNRVDFHFQALPTAMPEIKAGKVKVLALSSARRSPALPNVPTVAEELKQPAFNVTLWAGVFVPRNTPPAIIARLNQALNAVLQQAEVREALNRSGAETRTMLPAEFAAFVRNETMNYDVLIKEAFCAKLLYGGCSGFEAAVNALP